MKTTPKVGDTVTFAYVVPTTKTVPHLYPDAPEFQDMPAVFATGYMVGLMEWTCMKVLAPHLEPGEGSLGVDIRVDHTAATLPGQTVTVTATVRAVDGRRITFDVLAHDGLDRIGAGTHTRAILPWARFRALVDAKAARADVPPLTTDQPPSEHNGEIVRTRS